LTPFFKKPKGKITPTGYPTIALPNGQEKVITDMEVLYAEAEQALIEEEWARFGKKVKKGQERRKALQDLQTSGSIIGSQIEFLELGHQRMPRVLDNGEESETKAASVVQDSKDHQLDPTERKEKDAENRKVLMGSGVLQQRSLYPPAPSLSDVT